MWGGRATSAARPPSIAPLLPLLALLALQAERVAVQALCPAELEKNGPSSAKVLSPSMHQVFALKSRMQRTVDFPVNVSTEWAVAQVDASTGGLAEPALDVTFDANHARYPLVDADLRAGSKVVTVHGLGPGSHSLTVQALSEGVALSCDYVLFEIVPDIAANRQLSDVPSEPMAALPPPDRAGDAPNGGASVGGRGGEGSAVTQSADEACPPSSSSRFGTKVRIAFVDTYQTPSLDSQRQSFVQQAKLLPKLSRSDGSSFECSYVFVHTTEQSSPLHRELHDAGVPVRAFLFQISPSSYNEVSFPTMLRDTRALTDVDKQWRGIFADFIEYIGSFDAVVIPNRPTEPRGYDQYVFDLARLAGVRTRVMDLSQVEPVIAPTAFVAPSRFAASHPSVGQLQRPVFVVPPAVDVERFVRDPNEFAARSAARRRGGASAMLTVVYNGRLDAEASPGLFVRAAREVQATMPLVRFVVIGDGAWRPHLEQLAQRLRLQHMHFIGAVRSSLPAILRTADVFVSPSTAPEASSTAVLEAMSMKLPIVSFALGGVSELVQTGMNALVPDEATPEALAASIMELLSSEDLRESLGIAARRAAEARSVDKAMEASAALYLRLVSCASDE